MEGLQLWGYSCGGRGLVGTGCGGENCGDAPKGRRGRAGKGRREGQWGAWAGDGLL